MSDTTREEARREAAIDRGEFDPTRNCQKCMDTGILSYPATWSSPPEAEYCNCQAAIHAAAEAEGKTVCVDCCAEFATVGDLCEECAKRETLARELRQVRANRYRERWRPKPEIMFRLVPCGPDGRECDGGLPVYRCPNHSGNPGSWREMFGYCDGCEQEMHPSELDEDRRLCLNCAADGPDDPEQPDEFEIDTEEGDSNS